MWKPSSAYLDFCDLLGLGSCWCRRAAGAPLPASMSRRASQRLLRRSSGWLGRQLLCGQACMRWGAEDVT